MSEPFQRKSPAEFQAWLAKEYPQHVQEDLQVLTREVTREIVDKAKAAGFISPKTNFFDMNLEKHFRTAAKQRKTA